MNNHLHYLEEREEITHQLKKSHSQLKKLAIALALLCSSLLVMIGIMVSTNPGAFGQSEDTTDSAKVSETKPKDKNDEWQLILVNRDNLISKDFRVDLKFMGYCRVDCRIYDSLCDMIEDADKDGIALFVASGYRSVSEQKSLYDNKFSSYISLGYSREASKINTNQYIQTPGASEHHTGLAVDLATSGSYSLDESFAQTPAYEWLKENAAKYGFIERYPKDKENLTGINWEPWHYRFVGKANAEAISSVGICLEEFV